MVATGTCEPVFLEGVAGKLFAVFRHSITPAPENPAVLIFPPFAEEMNKSRRMFTLLAQRLAVSGISTLIVDHYGTGDSEGDFADARWEIWYQDTAIVLDWLHTKCIKKIYAVGMRLGALLALEVECRQESPFAGLVLWQPVISGQMAMTQFLRLRLASSLIGAGRDKETTKSLRERLSQGDMLEVAGYELSPDLFATIDQLHLGKFASSRTAPILWLELVGEGKQNISPSSTRVVEDWHRAGVYVITTALAGEPFWSLQEITVVPSLLDETVCHLARAVT